jgi:hypothetical protein
MRVGVDLWRGSGGVRGEEVDDDVPRDERGSMVTMAASIASRGRRWGRLELLWAAMCFRLVMPCSICCRLEHNRWIRRRAKSWRIGEGRGGGLGLTGDGGIGRTSSQRPRSPMSDCIRLAAFRAGGEKGEGGGLRGGLIATVRRRLRQENKENLGGGSNGGETWSLASISVQGRRWWRGPSGWVPHVSEGRRKAAYRFGLLSWAVGWILCWAEMASPSLFLFFFVLPSFLFLFSYLIHNFCRIHPNQFNPFSKIF